VLLTPYNSGFACIIVIQCSTIFVLDSLITCYYNIHVICNCAESVINKFKIQINRWYLSLMLGECQEAFQWAYSPIIHIHMLIWISCQIILYYIEYKMIINNINNNNQLHCSFLRAPSHDLAWYEYLLLDVIAFLLLIVATLVYITFALCRFICCRSKKLKTEWKALIHYMLTFQWYLWSSKWCLFCRINFSLFSNCSSIK